jgi:hypothetical protein
MEAFLATVKSEPADRFESDAHTKTELFDYIELFYNRRRRHSTLDCASPAGFNAARLRIVTAADAQRINDQSGHAGLLTTRRSSFLFR